jgi:hypothetical protein
VARTHARSAQRLRGGRVAAQRSTAVPELPEGGGLLQLRTLLRLPAGAGASETRGRGSAGRAAALEARRGSGGPAGVVY